MRVIVLAAGKGTRMNLDVPKVLAPLAGRPMIQYLLDAVMDAQIDPHPLIVIGHGAQQVREALAEYPVEFVEQPEQKGTGHAVAVCERAVQPDESIMVLCGDHPLVSAATIGSLADEHDMSGSVVTMMTYHVPDFDVYGGAFASFGRIIRDQSGTITAIREHKDANEQEKTVTEINPAYYAFSGPWVWEHIKRLDRKNAQGEYYLTDLIAMAMEEGKPVQAISGGDLSEAIGVNTPQQLQLAESMLHDRGKPPIRA